MKDGLVDPHEVRLGPKVVVEGMMVREHLVEIAAPKMQVESYDD